MNQSQVLNINYPIRIHEMRSCQCHRVRQKVPCHDFQSVIISHVLEKLWDDEIYQEYPQLVYVMQRKDDSYILDLVFRNNKIREHIMAYFKKYLWSESESCQIRKMVQKMTTICFCHQITVTNEDTCNAGFILVGNLDQMQMMSYYFNQNITPGEFEKLYYLKVSGIQNLSKDCLGYTLQVFLQNQDKLHQDPGSYTLVGLEKNFQQISEKKTKYSFSFGKREWNFNVSETPFECAIRELYEEFNVQFSHKLYRRSQEKKQSQYLRQVGFVLYFLYLDADTKVRYYPESETIYLDV